MLLLACDDEDGRLVCGRTVGVVDVDVHDDAGHLAAVGRGRYSMAVGR